MLLPHTQQVNLTFKQHSSKMKVSIHSSAVLRQQWFSLTFQFTESVGVSAFRNFLTFCCFIQAIHLMHTTSSSEEDELNHHGGACLNCSYQPAGWFCLNGLTKDGSCLVGFTFVSGTAAPPSSMQNEINNSTFLVATAPAQGFWDKATVLLNTKHSVQIN